MDRQTLRRGFVQCKGIAFTTVQRVAARLRRAALAAVIIAGPEPERDGVCAWTRADRAAGWRSASPTYHPSSMTRVLRRMGFSRQKARWSHPRRDAEARSAWGLRDILKATAARIPTSAYSCGFRMKRASATGRVCHRWSQGRRAPSATSGPTFDTGRCRSAKVTDFADTLAPCADNADFHVASSGFGSTYEIAPSSTTPRPSSTPVAKIDLIANRIVCELRLSMDHEGDFIGSWYKTII